MCISIGQNVLYAAQTPSMILCSRIYQSNYFYMFCSSLGQNLSTSMCVGEINFAIIIAILGLVLFALLIGNMQVSPTC